jgi:hypothetical protein
MNSSQINQAKFNDISQRVFQSSGMSFRITQRFNDKETIPSIKQIYTEQGRIGHDGLDIVVFDDVRAVEGGEVIFADWDTKMTWATKGMYFGFGIMTIIWNKENNRLWVYAHLSQNLGLEVGQIVKKGDYVGQMGGSGRGSQNAWNVHLHIGLYEVDGNPTVLNRQNGFWGGIDPLPYLIDNGEPVANQVATVLKPVFSNPVYQDMYEKNRLDMINLSINDRDEEIRRLKAENQELAQQLLASTVTLAEINKLELERNAEAEIEPKIENNRAVGLPLASASETFDFNKFWVGMSKNGTIQSILGVFLTTGISWICSQIPELKPLQGEITIGLLGFLGIGALGQNASNLLKSNQKY